MILSRKSILKAMKEGKIVINPFDENKLGPNSYDVTLGKQLILIPNGYNFDKQELAYDSRNPDMMATIKTLSKTIYLDDRGWLAKPGQCILGVTAEYTETFGYYPKMEGKSSIGRQFMGVCHLAGSGDDGYCGPWTIEITVERPIMLYPGMKIGQILYTSILYDEDEEPTYYSKLGKESRYNNNEAKPLSVRSDYQNSTSY